VAIPVEMMELGKEKSTAEMENKVVEIDEKVTDSAKAVGGAAGGASYSTASSVKTDSISSIVAVADPRKKKEVAVVQEMGGSETPVEVKLRQGKTVECSSRSPR
jgi:hypothetical protein